MGSIQVTDRSGSSRTVPAEDGHSVMEIVRDNCIDELLALCGGCCSCGTCHVHVDDEWLSALEAMGPDENDLLAMSDYRIRNSRLSCQIRFGSALDGLRVTIAPED